MTIFDQFEKTAGRYSNRNAISFFEEERLVSWTYGQFYKKVLALSEGLRHLGLRKGDRLAILAQNGPDWSLVDLAAARLGLILIPIHITLSVEQIKGILKQSKASALAVGSSGTLPSFTLYDLFPKMGTILAKLSRELSPRMTHIILMDQGLNRLDGQETCHLSKLVEVGEGLLRKKKKRKPVRIVPEDVSTLMYTSGTTGKMKAVVLTHKNFMSNTIPAIERTGMSYRDIFMIPLPLSHAFGRITALNAFTHTGCCIFFEKRLSNITQGLQVVKPTGMVAVPRLLEKMRESILQHVDQESRTISTLFHAGLKASDLYHRYRHDKNLLTPLFQLQNFLADRLIYRKIRMSLGEKLHLIVCGGGSLNPEVAQFFENIGITVLEGYGLTETSPIVTSNSYKKTKIGSVGLPLPGVKIRIGKNDEILVKGPNVMKGYDNNLEETRRVFDSDGWLHTGDQGQIDEEGYLYIKGLLKEIIITSYGKNITPVPVENQLEKSPHIKQAMIYGDNRPYVVALIVPNRQRVIEYLKKSSTGNHWERFSWTQICKRREVRDLITKDLNDYSTSLAVFEQPKRFAILPDEFTELNGLLTPTLKLRRKHIVEKYKEEIENLY